MRFFFSLYLPLLSWTILTSRAEIPWHVTLLHTLSSCLLCRQHLSSSFLSLWIYFYGRGGRSIHHSSYWMRRGSSHIPLSAPFRGLFLPVCTEWILVNRLYIAQLMAVRLCETYLTPSGCNFLSICLLCADVHTCKAKKKKKKVQTHIIPTPTCRNADTLWSWLHNSPGLFCSLVSQTDGLLCPRLCWTNEAWLEIWMSFTIICQQMTVTHPHISGVFMELVTASCSLFGHGCLQDWTVLTLKHEAVETSPASFLVEVFS